MKPIFPPEHHIPNVSVSRQAMLYVSPSCSTHAAQGIRDTPQGTSQSSEAGTPLGAPRCCHVSHTVCHTEHRACNILSSKATVVCFGLLFSFLFALGWEKKIPFHLGKMWKPLSQAIISSGRGKFPQCLDQALAIGMAPCCCSRSGSHCLWDS